MLIDLRHAGLGSEQEQRLKFASNGIAARRPRVAFSAWDGTRCTALVANADDAYGKSAMRIALQRGTPVIALARPGGLQDAEAAWLPSGASVQALMKAIEESLERALGRESTSAHDSVEDDLRLPTLGEASGLGLVRLCRASDTHNLRASVAGRSYVILRRAGRIRARSLSDVLSLEAKLGDAGWQLESLPERPRLDDFEIGASLDSVLLNAAFRAREKLPRFADGQYWLDDWPDLGRAAQHPHALTVVRRLRRGKTDVESLAIACGGEARDVNACLWAFAAAGLLQQQHDGRALRSVDDGGRHASPPRWKGMLQRLARHFGMAEHGY